MWLREWRRDLHANPELLYDVHRTAAFLADKLRAFGCDEIFTRIGKTGVVGVIKGQWAAAAFCRNDARPDATSFADGSGRID